MSSSREKHTGENTLAQSYQDLLDRAAALGFHYPSHVDPDQAWFWTRDWLSGEIEASEELAAGEAVVFDSDEQFLSALE